MPENQRWTYFLAMKLHGVKSKPYLSQVLALSHSIAELYGRIYSHLLGTDVKSKGFMSQYDERKDLIESLDIPVAIVSDFCKQAESKGKDGIWYLTDRRKCRIIQQEVSRNNSEGCIPPIGKLSCDI